MDLPDDLFFIIIDFLFDTIGDFCKARLVNKKFNKKLNNKWMKPGWMRCFGKRTFVNFRDCQICDNKSNYTKTVPYGFYPRPEFVYCKNYECCRSIIRSIIENAKDQGIVILTQPSVNSYEGTCPRSDGSVSACLFERGWLWLRDPTEVPRIRCLLDGNMIKDVAIDKIDKKFLNSYKILKL
ncbi:MAG: hypothetical protein CMF41_04220 [Legionellales bacterium]|nr:hypothetical protein [Legionellales bacterium]|tara:strand:+ start:8214 stop:8759 length:546 start_codon:yes stop_codon:yes gene_type:complete